AEHFCWWDGLVDESRAPFDRAALRGRGDFSADLVGLADRLLADPEAARALAEALDAPPRTMLGDLEEILGGDDALAALIDEAADLALEVLGEGAA
ncbi:MAG: hypothetical protein JWM85_2262, partial [Acidimicrobiaceae bacterium]|nr:hypothetical protein [Acidimicrobiaceae bacterium]